MSYNNQLPIVWQYFTNIAAIQNMGVFLQQIWLYDIIGGMFLMCQNATMQVYGHGLKLNTFYVRKHIAGLAICHNQVLVRDKPLGVPASVKLVYSTWSTLKQLDCFYMPLSPISEGFEDIMFSCQTWPILLHPPPVIRLAWLWQVTTSKNVLIFSWFIKCSFLTTLSKLNPLN